MVSFVVGAEPFEFYGVPLTVFAFAVYGQYDWCHIHEIFTEISVLKLPLPAPLFKQPSYQKDLANHKMWGRGDVESASLVWKKWEVVSKQSTGAVGATGADSPLPAFALEQPLCRRAGPSAQCAAEGGPGQGQGQGAGVYSTCLTDANAEAISENKYWNTA